MAASDLPAPSLKGKEQVVEGEEQVAEPESSRPSSVVVQSDSASGDTKLEKQGKSSADQSVPWTKEEFYLPESYFRDICKLPSKGKPPALIDDIVVTDQLLAECFGPKEKRNGYKVEHCTRIDLDEINALCLVTDGHEKTVKDFKKIPVTMAKGLYVERILHKPINWAAFAVSKLKNQISHSFIRKESRPTGPPIIRVPTVYRPPQWLVDAGVRDAVEDHTIAVPGTSGPPTGKNTIPQFFSIPRIVPDVKSPYKPLSVPKTTPVTTPSKMSSQELGDSSTLESTTCVNPTHGAVPFNLATTPFLMIMNECLGAEIVSVGKSIEAMNKEHAIAAAELATIEEKKVALDLEFRVAVEEQRLADGQLMLWLGKRKNDVDKKLELGAELDAACEAEDDDEYDRVEAEMKEVNHHLVIADGQVQMTNCRIQVLDGVVSSSKVSSRKLAAEKLAVGTKIRAKDNEIAAAKEKIRAVKKEYEILSNHFEKGWTCLKPKVIPTSLNVETPIYKVSSCPVCCNGFHCNNWLPTSCGHTYHPACLVPLVVRSVKTPSCLVCGEVFHPDWLEAWGVDRKSTELSDMAEFCDLSTQRSEFNDSLVELYKSGALTLDIRRQSEKRKQLVHTRIYAKEAHDKEAERAQAIMYGTLSDWANVSDDDDTQLLEDTPECLQNPKSEKAGQVSRVLDSLVKPKLEKDEQSREPLPKCQNTQAKTSKKRKCSSSEESPRIGKVVTRNASKAELGTSDSTPIEGVAIAVKELDSIVTPAFVRQGKQGRGRKNLKESGKGMAGRYLRRKLTLK